MHGLISMVLPCSLIFSPPTHPLTYKVGDNPLSVCGYLRLMLSLCTQVRRDGEREREGMSGCRGERARRVNQRFHLLIDLFINILLIF